MNILKRFADSGWLQSGHYLFKNSVVLLFVATIAGIGAYSYYVIDNAILESALLRKESVAQLAAVNLSEKIGRKVDTAFSLSTRVQFRKFVSDKKWDEAIKIMRDIPRDFPQIDRVLIMDSEGTLKADTPALPAARGNSFRDKDWYKGTSDGWQTFISAAHIRQASPHFIVYTITLPIRNDSGDVVGTLGLQIYAEKFFQWVKEINVQPDTVIYIIDSKGQLVFDSSLARQGALIDLSANPIVQKMLHGKQGAEFASKGLGGIENVILGSAFVPDYGWGVLVQQPERSSYIVRTRHALLWQLLMGYGLIMLLTAATIIQTSRIARARQKEDDYHQMKTTLERRVQERTAELKAANQELEAFSYSVSHDLRTPLRAIDGFSLALLEDHSSKLDDQGRDYLNRARAATQRMGKIIDDMLVLSRITRSEIKNETVDLSALATEVLTELQNSEPERKVDWHIEPNLTAEGDKNLLRVALTNLLGNSWKYTARQPQPRIEFGAINNPDGSTNFFVRDNGIGFDMAYSNKLFTAFQRLHNIDEFSGTGIGLAIVQRVIQRHHGEIRGEGKPDQGATFFFTLRKQT